MPYHKLWEVPCHKLWEVPCHKLWAVWVLAKHCIEALMPLHRTWDASEASRYFETRG